MVERISSGQAKFLTWLIGGLIAFMTVVITFQNNQITTVLRQQERHEETIAAFPLHYVDNNSFDNIRAEIDKQHEILNRIPDTYVPISRYTRVIDLIEKRTNQRILEIAKLIEKQEKAAEKREGRIEHQFQCITEKLDEFGRYQIQVMTKLGIVGQTNK